MSITECKGRGIYLVGKGTGFELHVRLESNLMSEIDMFKRIVNDKLSWSNTGIHVCMTRHGDEVHFQSSSFTAWRKPEADKVFANIWEGLTIFEAEVAFKKRKRQVRDIFNKCEDRMKIEAVAEILKS